jgi:ATP-dependent Clp protease, protease subunit
MANAERERELCDMVRNESERAAEPREAREPVPLVSEHLFASRTVLIFGEIDAQLAKSVTAQLLALAAQSRDPIRILINSPGGHVESGDTLHDVIRFVEPEVKIIATGWCASAGALIYAGARRENRLALPNTRFLLHQPLGGVGGPASDVEIEARQIVLMRERLNQVFSAATGQPLEKIAQDTERNHWLTASEALAYGLVGRIVETASELPSPRRAS